MLKNVYNKLTLLIFRSCEKKRQVAIPLRRPAVFVFYLFVYMTYLEFKLPSPFSISPLVAGRTFAGMAAGDFTDMHGRSVSFAKNDMPAFQRNTNRLIQKFLGRGMPGLPVDARNHDKGEAAGWLTAVELGETDEGVPALVFQPQWTELGVNLIATQQVVNFSPTVNLNRKTVLGGSLTNWAATVDADGVPIFRAIELQQSPDFGDTMDKEELLELLARERATMVSDLATALGLGAVTDAGTLHELIEKQTNVRLEQRLAELQRTQELADLARDLVGGHDFGLPAVATDLARELQNLPANSFPFWQKLLTTIVNSGLTDYRQLGHGRVLNRKKTLPDFVQTDLRAGKIKLTDLTNSILAGVVGDLNEYDTTEFGGN